MGKNDPKPIPELTAKDIARYWSRVDRRSDAECWPWKGGSCPRGYGRFYAGPRPVRSIFAHRIAFMLATGRDPGTLDVLHRCDYPPCTNPTHLFLGTHKDNLSDAASKGRMQSGDRHYLRRHPEFVRHGEKTWNSKLKDGDVTEIRALYAAGALTQEALAAKFGVSHGVIWKVINRRIWKHVL